MGVNTYRGDAQGISQIQNLTVEGTIDAFAETITLTINRKAITYNVVGTEANTSVVAANMFTLLTAGTVPAEFSELTIVNTNNTISLQSDPGIPFTATASKTGNITFNSSIPQNATGPWHWNNANNWSNGTIPALPSEDVVIPPGGSLPIAVRYGMNQSLVVVKSLTIQNPTVGLPDDTGSYIEYRDRYLKIQTGNLTIQGTGTGLIRLDLNNLANTTGTFANILIGSTPNSNIQGIPALQVINTHANTSVNALSGTIGFALAAAESATIQTLRIGFVNSPASDVTILMGTNVTLSTINQAGGILTINSNVTTINQTDGTTVVYAGNIVTLNGQGGSLSYQTGSGTITTLICGTDFTFDLSQDLRPKTLTTTTLFPSSKFYDPFKVAVFTNPILISGCGLSELTLDLGSNFNIQRS